MDHCQRHERMIFLVFLYELPDVAMGLRVTDVGVAHSAMWFVSWGCTMYGCIYGRMG